MGIVSTNERDCRDCYRCVRTCAVKAVQVNDGRARVIDERCVMDGRCINACPQHAKVVERGLEQAQDLLKAGEFVVASLAPSFPVSSIGSAQALASALRRLGFAYVEETAVAARYVAREHRRLAAKRGMPMITSSCPSLISLVEKHHPTALDFLAPVVSPMIAHGRLLRAAHPDRDIRVVFIGPCVAKKGEVQDPRVAGAVDVALSFLELEEWLAEEGVTLTATAEVSKDATPFVEPARLFPIEGGLFHSAELPTGLVDERHLVISGFEECVEFLGGLPESLSGYQLVEMLICPGGCVNGPLVPEHLQVTARRRRLFEYVTAEETTLPRVNDYDALTADLSRSYVHQPIYVELPSESDIQAILAQTGKTGSEDELNCGACGYQSCRDKAVAVYQGMAEVEMCLPYMRRQAESTTARFIQQTPIGIVVVKHDLRIVQANHAWGALFDVELPVPEGTKLGSIVSPTLFRSAIKTGAAVTTGRLRLPKQHRYVDLHIFPLPQEEAVVGVFMDITTQEQQRAELLMVREETLQRTQEVVERQMRTAQEIAGLLGETTADTKALLYELMQLVRAAEPESTVAQARNGSNASARPRTPRGRGKKTS